MQPRRTPEPSPLDPRPLAPRGPRRRKVRREVLSADLDRLDTSRALWGPDEAETGALPLEELRDAVREAVATALTDKQREVVEACFFEGVSQGEIARRLGVAQQVVEKRLHGALRGGRRVGGALARLREVLTTKVGS